MTISGQKVWETPGDRHGIWSAILFADMVAYSRLMSIDELGTLEFMVGCSRIIEEVGRAYGGILVQTTGDGFLLLFQTSEGAVGFGHELHRHVAKHQVNVAEPAQFRVGIHAGEVYRSGGMIHGHAVNIAARLESEALPGTCVVSQDIYDEVSEAGEIDQGLEFEALGAPPLKNIAERIPLYRVVAKGGAPRAVPTAVPQIRVLGGLGVHSAATDLVFNANRKTAALLGYLALSSGRRERNDKIASVLWPDRPASAAARSFANTRRRLSDDLSQPFSNLLFSANGHTGLNELHFETDLGSFLAELRRGRVNPVLIDEHDWPAQILDGIEPHNRVFAAWRKVTQTTWRDRMLAELSDLISRTRIEDDVRRDAARAVLALEPGNEVASAALIAHLGERGNRAAALDEYQRLSEYLSKAHGLTPSDRVEAARRALTGGNDQRVAESPPARPEPAQRRLLRITVAPFTAPEGVDTLRLDGFRSELVSNLSRFREWSVTQTNEQTTDAGETGDPAPRYAYAIEGSLLGDDLFHLYLRDVAAGRVIWSSDVALESANWVASQRTAIGRIAAHLETYISADRLSHLIGADEHQATSHDHWLRAEQIFARWTPEAADEAELLLRAVTQDDPAFAPAFSSRASFRNVRHVIHPGMPRNDDDAREAHDLAKHAVELDPLDARNHLAVAWTAAMTGAFDRAAIHLDMATSLNPNGQVTLVSCAMAYAFIGQADRGEALIDHVRRIAPMLNEYQWCYVAGRVSEVVEIRRRCNLLMI